MDLIQKFNDRHSLIILIMLTLIIARTPMLNAADEEFKNKMESQGRQTPLRYKEAASIGEYPNSFSFSQNKLLVNKETLTPVHLREDSPLTKVRYTHNGKEYLASQLLDVMAIPTNLELIDFVQLYPTLPPEILGPARKGHQLLEWDSLHRFCSKCGSSTTASLSSNEHYKICSDTKCAEKYYPKIQPVVVVGVERGEELLMARGPSFPPDIYTILAGFVEPGETLEEAAKREVKEETGIDISDLEYVGSQSWQSPTQIIAGFRAQYKGGELVVDKTELEDAAFFHVGALPRTFPGKDLTVSQEIISLFKSKFE
jgi:NAD+ diphosphatase